MASLNKVMLIGRLGRDPLIKMAGSTKLAEFSLAVSDKFVGKDGVKKDRTEWVNIVIWGKLAEIVERFVKKGSELYVEGRLETQSWDDKDGKKIYKTLINCNQMQMLGGNSNNSNSSNQSDHRQQEEHNNQAGHSQSYSGAPEVIEDDLPF